MSIRETNEAEFEQVVLKSEQPVLVDFWAPRCQPCRALAPIIEQIATEYDGKIKVVKTDADENYALTSRYGIRGIPTLLFFKSGAVRDQLVGLVSKEKIEEIIQKHL